MKQYNIEVIDNQATVTFDERLLPTFFIIMKELMKGFAQPQIRLTVPKKESPIKKSHSKNLVGEAVVTYLKNQTEPKSRGEIAQALEIKADWALTSTLGTLKGEKAIVQTGVKRWAKYTLANSMVS